MKLELKGRFNNTLIAFILDGGKDDSLINMTELARRLDTSRQSLVKYASDHGLEKAIHHFLARKKQKAAKRRII